MTDHHHHLIHGRSVGPSCTCDDPTADLATLTEHYPDAVTVSRESYARAKQRLIESGEGDVPPEPPVLPEA